MIDLNLKWWIVDYLKYNRDMNSWGSDIDDDYWGRFCGREKIYKRVQLENWYYATFFKIDFFGYYYSVDANDSIDVSDLYCNRQEVPLIVS